MERDKSLYYKEGYNYWVNRSYHIKLDITLLEPVHLSFDTVDINNNKVEIPLVTLSADGHLIIYPGYVWDGASGPTWNTLNSMIGSLVHDVLYQFIRLGFLDDKYKEYADKMLHDLCTADGMWSWRADYWQWAVKEWGIGATRPSAEHLEKVAP